MKSRILIADDAPLNREMLDVILSDKYETVFAEDGVEAVEILGGEDPIDLLLLDVNMPRMDGFEVLRVMNERRWIDDIPVIIISAEDNAEFIANAYSLGVTDYINRPFYSVVVERRVENTLLMYSKQKRLVRLVEEQVHEREKINNSMINIFSNIIEMRNHESGTHTFHVQTITSLLLGELTRKTDRYHLTKSDISLISTLSALHDIGKIKIPDAVLNKPGKLDADEWALMKTHTVEGDAIMASKELDQSSKFVRTARSICRWHHEKYDGRGYPDGLKGDDIPIAAQVVSLADVYDALTSERCYKRAFPHDQAIEMILNGECGAFNPLLLECLKEVSEALRELESSGEHYDFESTVGDVADELLADNDLPHEDLVRRMLEGERRKKEFFMECSNGIQFEYDKLNGKVTFIHLDPNEHVHRRMEFASRDTEGTLLPGKYWDAFREKLMNADHENPVVSGDVELCLNGALCPHHAVMMPVFVEPGQGYTCVVGQFTPIGEKQ